MNDIVRNFIVGLLALVEEINRLLLVRVDFEQPVTKIARLEEAIDWLHWLLSAISEENIGGVSANFKGQREDIKRNLEALQLQLLEKKRLLESEIYQCQREQSNVRRLRFIISQGKLCICASFLFSGQRSWIYLEYL